MTSTIVKRIAAGVVALFAAAEISHAQTVTWGSAFGSQLLDSKGDNLTGEFEFELGSFHPGFDPAAVDPSLWQAGWEAFDRATTANGSFASGIGFINKEVAIDENGMTTSTEFDPEGQDYDFRDSDIYLWAYKGDKNLDGGNEFALITDPAWKFPATVSPTGNPLGYRVALTNTAVMGSSANGSFDLQTAAVSVPEPSSAVLIALTIGYVLMRRRR